MLDNRSLSGSRLTVSSHSPSTRPPKVSILASDLSKQGAGRWGGAVRPFLLRQALQKIGYEVEIVGFTTDDSSAYETDASIQAIPITSPHLDIRAVRALFNRMQGDIIYAYKLKPSSFGLALLHRLKHHKPVILDIDDWELSWHGGDAWKYRPSLRQLARDVLKPDGALRQPDHPFYLKRIETWVSRADLVTTHNGFLQNRFGGVYVPNGKDTALFDPAKYSPEESRQQYGLSPYRVVMFPGAPRPYKGLEDLLTAIASLNEPDIRLVIVGGSPYDDYDQQLMARWGQWIVKLPGFPAEQMPSVIAAAHVVAVPQRDTLATRAQFPLKLTDGMSMAKPVLASRVGDIPLILGETGYLVDPESPEQLATQLKAIFHSLPAAQALGLRARERCCQLYSIEAMASQLEKALKPFHKRQATQLSHVLNNS